MTTKDITRFLDQPKRHYAAAYLQQGRPLLDSDFNEGARLLAEDRRRAFNDLTGAFGCSGKGFRLALAAHPDDPEQGTIEPLRADPTVALRFTSFNGNSVGIYPVVIEPGTAYLGGMRFELERLEFVGFQRDFINARTQDFFVDSSLANGGFVRLYYLHAWEQVVTAAEDQELLEQSLAGPDTMVRVRRMRRVEISQLPNAALPPANCDEAFSSFVAGFENGDYDYTNGELRSRGRLQLLFVEGSDDDPCTPDPPGQYLGTENQTLRVMLTDPDHYVWAIDNGAPLYRVRIDGLDGRSQLRATMLTPPRDLEHRPREGQVVEFLSVAALIDPDVEALIDSQGNRVVHFNKLAAEIGVFTRVIGEFRATDNSFGFDLNATTSTGRTVRREIEDQIAFNWDPGHPGRQKDHLSNTGLIRYCYMRLWHDAAVNGQIEIPVNRSRNPGQPQQIALGRTGLFPAFLQPGRRGDFWTAALRVDARDRITPLDLMTDAGASPHGPRHFYMPLALLDFAQGTARDCRPRLRQLRDTGCETRTVGDSPKSIGDFKTINEAIASLPLGGGRVVVRPGVYREELSIPNGVTLEGCGEDTILETPDPAGAEELVRVEANDVTIRNFVIHAVEQAAIHVVDAERLEVSSITAASYMSSGSVIQPGSVSEQDALFELDSLRDSRLRSIRIESAGRQALRLEGGENVRIEGLVAMNDRGTTMTRADAALLGLGATPALVLRDVSVEAYGRVALRVEGLEHARLSKLDLFVGANDADDVPTQSAVDIAGGDDIVLSESRLAQEASPSEHAAVVLTGNDIVLQDNRIQSFPHCFDQTVPADPEDCADPLNVAWGGIQVRYGSERVTLLRNHILGGLGHGVTLGSVVWGTTSSATQREGAGKVQVHIDINPNGGVAYVDGLLAPGFDGLLPFIEEGVITDLLIAENRIEQMGSCGISVLTVLGLVDSGETDLFQVSRLRIERNTITENLKQLAPSPAFRTDAIPLSGSTSTTAQDVQVLPYAGITLGSVVAPGSTISGNQIVNNGSSSTIPICGVFILNGDSIVISKNRILDNGARPNSTDTLVRGVRAGIAVLLAGTDTVHATADLDALLAVESPPGTEARSLNSGEFALRIHDNVVRQPEGRALHAISAGMVSIDGNFLVSRGYHGVAGATIDDRAVGDVVYVQGLGGPWETFDADTINFADFLTTSRVPDWLNNTRSPRLYAGGGGGVLFHNNQVVYDWDVRVAPTTDPLSFFPVVILAADHAGVIGNQFAMRLALGSITPPPADDEVPEPILAHALIGGFTTQVARNRVAEPIASARISLITSGEVQNITALNIGTHLTLAYRWGLARAFTHPDFWDDPNNAAALIDIPQSFYDAANLTLFLPDDLAGGATDTSDPSNPIVLKNDLVGTIRAFFTLMNQLNTRGLP